VKRIEVVQRIIDRKKARRYLEIGVANGTNFFRIRARRKTAVDPYFKFSGKRKVEWVLKNPRNLFARYCECPSDDFFASAGPADQFDVVFVDGLHTFRQSLRDVLNSMAHLTPGGVIVMHDCNPQSESAAHPAESFAQAAALNLPGWEGAWSGDVWKTICYLRSQRKDLRVFVLDADGGLGIVTKGKPESPLALTEEALHRMTYQDLAKERNNLLNLKDESYLSEFLKTI
jgi:SAM-dependent methyltransferase